MAQVYIRSQNKEALYVFNNFQGIEYGTTDYAACKYFGGK